MPTYTHNYIASLKELIQSGKVLDPQQLTMIELELRCVSELEKRCFLRKPKAELMNIYKRGRQYWTPIITIITA